MTTSKRPPANRLGDMPTNNRPINLGTSMADQATRFDGVAKVTGKAKYGRDRYLDNSLFISFIRCPWGSATLEGTNEAAARNVDGCLEVNVEGDRGRFHGHSVGYIVAENKHALRRAMRALAPQWKRGDDVKTLITDTNTSDPDPSLDARKTLADAAHVVSAVYTTAVQTHSSLETHGAVIDHKGDSAVAYVSTQGTASATDGLGDALGLADADFEVDCEYVGGGFGSKLGGAGKEGLTAARVAAKYKRPVSLFVERDEEHLDTGNRPSSRSVTHLGCDANGKILGGFVRTYGGVGVARGGGGVAFPSGRYQLGNVDSGRTESVQFNAGGPRAFRAPGHPQGAFAEELVIDELAAKAGVDPLDMRLMHETDDDRKDMLRQATKLIGWNDRQANGSQSGTIRRGFGLGAASWGRFPAGAAAEVVLRRDGSVEVRTGTQDIGTGMRTVSGVVAADQLGISHDNVSVRIGSSRLPEGPGSGGSMTAHNTLPVIMDAAANAREELLDLLASRANGNINEYSIADGNVMRDGKKVMTFEQACALMPGESILGTSSQSRRNREPQTKFGGEGHSHGVQAVDLSVDIETGVVKVNRIIAVQSCGRVICRKTTESQIIGGVIQGLSYALFEDKILDRNTGAMVNPNFEMYKIAGPNDMPHIEPVLWTRGQTGVRSLGEPPIIPTAGAIACAVLNAVGAPVRSTPITPQRVLAAVSSASSGGAS